MPHGLISLDTAILKKKKDLLSSPSTQTFPGCGSVQQALVVSTEDKFKLQAVSILYIIKYAKPLILTH